MKELQYVVSVLEREDGGWTVKLGSREIGTVLGPYFDTGDAQGAWQARAKNFSEEYESRSRAVMALVARNLDARRDFLEYESQGLRVVLNGSKFQCTNCERWVPGSEVGLRRINDTLIRNQSQCKSCRTRHGVEDEDA